MKNRTNLLIAVFLCFSITAYAADVVKEQSGYKTTRVYKQVYPNGTSEFFNEVNYDYGSYMPGQNQASNFYRSIWEFSLPTGLPTGYYVKKVELKFKCNSLESFIMNYISDYPSNPTYEQKWNLIENGTFVGQFVGSNGTTYTQEIPEPVIRDLIQQAHDQSKSKVYISFQTDSEFRNTDLVSFSTLALKITYGIKVQLTTETNFNTGSMLVNGETKNYDDIVKLTENSSNTFGAVEPQTDLENDERVWNDTEGPINLSDWILKRPNRDEFNKGTGATITYVANAVDQGSKMIANYRKNYKISRNDQTEFDGTVPAGIVTHIVELNSKNVLHPSIPAGGKTYNFGYWVGTSGDNYTPTGNATLTAFYKYANHSNSSNAFANNSQRKVIKPNEVYKVYTSNNHIWLEVSGDGVSWSLVGIVDNPSEGPEAKNPSIDFAYSSYDQDNPYNIYITYQQKTFNNKYKIKLVKFNSFGNKIFSYDVQTSLNDYSTEESTPVIGSAECYSSNLQRNKIVLVWKEHSNTSLSGGLYYRGCIDLGSSISWYYNPQLITGSSNNNSNPTMDVLKDNFIGTVPYFHLAYQYLDTKIKYCRLAYGISGLVWIGPEEEPSSGSGITKNYKPSISVVNLDSNYPYTQDSPKLTWSANFGGQDYFVQFRDKSNSVYGSTWNSFHSYYSPDYEIKNVNINKTIEDDYFAFSFIEGNSNKYVKSTALSSVQTLSTHGTDLQVSGGIAGWAGMQIISYNTSSYPYNFSKAATLIMKANQNISFEGRAGTVKKGDIEFYFSISNVTLDGDKIEFVEKNDTVKTTDKVLMNKYLETIPFSISDNNILTCTISSWVNDSRLAKNELEDKNYFKYRTELVDKNTGEVLGIINEIIQSKEKMESISNQSYKVDLTNFGARDIILRVVEEDNLNGEYSFTKVHGSNYNLSKTSYTEINLAGTDLIIKDYSLAQNYPNPFNPATTINYQIPKDGFVTLKIYDVLGKEIATLVNENKAPGRYNIDFNAR